MTELVRTRHTVSGKIAEVPQAIFEHPTLGKYLERVDEDAKPYEPEMHVPREADKDEVVFAGPDHSDELTDEYQIVGFIEAPESDEDDK